MDREPHDETEYQFNDAEDATFEPASETKASAADSDRPKRSSTSKAIVTLIILVVAAFIVYKLFSFFAAPKTKSTAAMVPISSTIKKPSEAIPQVPTSISQQIDAQPAIPSMPQEPSQPVSTISPQQDQQAAAMTTLVKAIGDVQTSSNAISEKLTQNDSRMNSLEQQISDLNGSISQLQNGLSSVQTNLVKTRALENQIKHYRQQLNVLTAKKIRLRKQYFVQAVVPGRVWLRGADGSVSTVAVGDTLSGYGKITSIDPYSGTVTTSTGVKIYYGLDEN